jgi:uncharacterized protein
MLADADRIGRFHARRVFHRDRADPNGPPPHRVRKIARRIGGARPRGGSHGHTRQMRSSWQLLAIASDGRSRVAHTHAQITRERPSVDASTPSSIAERVAALDWTDIAAQLDACGCATAGALVTGEECAALAGMYASDAAFRSRIVMSRHGFGRGEYKYFSYPLPDTIMALREELYSPLADIANRWNEQLGTGLFYPGDHAAYLVRCHQAGQNKPTPLLLQYGAGDYNCLHQDLYGDHVFPLQVVFLLSRPNVDFTGGELILTEQRPRMQSRAEVVPLRQGEGVIFPVHHRPVHGTRGIYRVTMRHGVSRVRSGHRHTVGIIFHDAK